MNATIVRPDNIVVVDGLGLAVDCSDLDPVISVVQWGGTAGHIEYVNPPYASEFKTNTLINDFAPYQKYVDAWHAAKQQQEQTLKEAKRQS
jgi:hypothetical protein